MKKQFKVCSNYRSCCVLMFTHINRLWVASLLIAITLLYFPARSQTVQGNNGFAGEKIDSASSLVNLRARRYDPETGIFVCKDPLGAAASLNGYSYCNNNPINCVDPTGLLDGWLAARSGVGIVGNGLMFLGGWATSELAVGIPFAIYGGVGVGANFWNFKKAIFAQENKVEAVETGAGTIFAQGVMGGYQLAGGDISQNTYQNVTLGANAVDLTVSLSSGKFIGESAPWAAAYGITQSKTALALLASADKTDNTLSSIEAYTKSGETLGISLEPPPTIESSSLAPTATYDSGGNNPPSSVSMPSSTPTPDQNWLHLTPDEFNGFNSTMASPPIGGVLLDKAAQLVGQNLSEITGAMYDPVSGQFVFLGTNSPTPVKNINLDYLTTALQAVYGSAVPPFVTLVPSTEILSSYSQQVSIQINNQILTGKMQSPFSDPTGFGNIISISGPGFYNGVFFGGSYNQRSGAPSVVIDPNDYAYAIMSYSPIWTNQDTTVDVWLHGYDYGSALNQQLSFFWKARFNCSGTNLLFSQWIADSIHGVTLPPSGVSLSYGNGKLKFGNGPDYILIDSVNPIPARQQRQFGGRVEGTMVGWIMEEADRTMKCLCIGSNNLSGDIYNSSTIHVSGYKNLFELYGNTPPSAFLVRDWFTPQLMTLEQFKDPITGLGSIIFTNATVLCQTESLLNGGTSPPQQQAFCNNMTQNYDAFAALKFPCYDPTDPTGSRIVSTNIFGMLKDVMKAVSLARFFRDNSIPVDMWWLNSWQPPSANIPKSVPTIMNWSGNNAYFIEGGVQIQLPNTYIASVTASNVALLMQSSRPAMVSNTSGDIQQQSWTNTTSVGTLTAVAVNSAPEPQDGNIQLAETDLSFASPGSLPLRLTRYYQSSWLGGDAMGPGWVYTPYLLQFSRPSWYDDYGWMSNYYGIPLPLLPGTSDTGLRSGNVRVISMSSGATLDFYSSLVLGYAVDTNNNPYITLNGLNTNGVPNFTPGLRQNGSVLIQASSQREYQLFTPDGSVLVFDSNGKLLYIQDRNGWEQDYTYDSVGHLLTITDDAQQALLFGYDSKTNILTSVVGPNGEQMKYSYTTNGCLATATHMRSGASVSYGYNTNRQLVAKTLFNGLNVIQSQPDLKGRANTNLSLRGNSLVKTYTQGSAGTVRTNEIHDPKITDPQFVSRRLQRDRSGRMLASRAITGAETSFGYNANSLLPNVVALPIAGRPPISIQRDGYGRPTRISDPGNTNAQDVTATYDTNTTLLRQVTDEAGNATQLAYDGNQNLTGVQSALGAQSVNVNFAYTPSGALSSLTNPLGITVVTMKRDNLDRVTNVVDATGVSIAYQYDSLGRLWKLIDPQLASPVVYVYDNFDRVIAIQMPAGTIYYNYDPKMGWLASQTDLLGRTTRYDRDPKTGDVLQTIQIVPGGANLTTVMSYDRFGHLASVTPPQSSTITYNFDASGRQIGNVYSGISIPGAPNTLTCNNATNGVPTTYTNFVFSWLPPVGSSGVAGYSYALDQMPANITNTATTNAVINGVTVGTHLFQVCAQDTNGLWGPTADFQLVVTNPPGAIPPDAPVNLICDHATNNVPVLFNSTAFTFSWSIPVSQNGIAGYSFALDQLPSNSVSTVGLSALYTNVTLGTHLFHVQALGSNGLWGATADFTLLVQPGPTTPDSPVITCDHATNGIPTYFTNLTFTWSVPNSLIGVAGYSFAFDQAPPNSILTTATTSVITNVPFGVHQFEVKALGLNGIWGAPSSFSLLVFSPPSAPVNLVCDHAVNGMPTGTTNLTFSWLPPVVNAGINGYSYGFDQIPTNTTNTYSTSVAIYNVTLGTHQFYVMAQDTNGVWGPTTSFTLIVSQPPAAPSSITCDHATNGVPTYFTNLVFSWFVPNSLIGVAGYSYALDRSPGNSVMTIATNGMVANVSAGSHVFQVQALGQGVNGIWGLPATFALIVVNPPGPPLGLVCNHSAIMYSGGYPSGETVVFGYPTSISNLVFSWKQSINSAGINGYSYSLNQYPNSTITTVDTNATIGNPSSGTNTFYVKAQDTNGVWGQTADFSFVYWPPGSVPPGTIYGLTCNVAANNQPTTITNNIVFSWQQPTSENGVAGYSYALNGTPTNVINSTTNTVTFATIAVGTNTFQVMAQGNNGVWGPVSSFKLVILPSSGGGNGPVGEPLLPPGGIALLAVLIAAIGYGSLSHRRAT